MVVVDCASNVIRKIYVDTFRLIIMATKAQLVYAWHVIKSMRLSKEEQLELYYEIKGMNVDAARYFLADLSRHYGTGDRDCVWEWLG